MYKVVKAWVLIVLAFSGQSARAESFCRFNDEASDYQYISDNFESAKCEQSQCDRSESVFYCERREGNYEPLGAAFTCANITGSCVSSIPEQGADSKIAHIDNNHSAHCAASPVSYLSGTTSPELERSEPNVQSLDSTPYLPQPQIVEVREDDRVARIEVTTPNLVATTGRAPRVGGYKYVWGPLNKPDLITSLSPYPMYNMQPLVNGERYSIKVYAIGYRGELSAPSVAVGFTGDSTRVEGLRQKYLAPDSQGNPTKAGFFEDFNRPQGRLDELNWRSSYSLCNRPELNGAFINDQFHAHNMAAVGDFSGPTDPYKDICDTDRGSAVNRVVNRFLDFSDINSPEKYRTISWDMDGLKAGRATFYLELFPAPSELPINSADMSGHLGQNISSAGFHIPYLGLRLKQGGGEDSTVVQLAFVGPDGQSALIDQFDYKIVYDLDLNKVGLSAYTNVRRNWELRLGRTWAELYIDGRRIFKTKPDAFNFTFNKYTVFWHGAFLYNQRKQGLWAALLHWDNFGFDGPVGPGSSIVTHNYVNSLGGENTLVPDSYGAYSARSTTSINIPDSLSGALAQRLLFTVQSKNWTNAARVSVNGTEFAIPFPKNPPTFPADDLPVEATEPRTVTIDLPNGTLRGNASNEIKFKASPYILNLHVEIDFNKSSAPPYTQPSLAAPGILIPQAQYSGGDALITRVNNVLTHSNNPDESTHDGHRTRFRSVPHSGVIDISAEVSQWGQMITGGKTTGLSRVDIIANNQVVDSIRADYESPTAVSILGFTLDTCTLPNGINRIGVEAIDPEGRDGHTSYANGVDGDGDPDRDGTLFLLVDNENGLSCPGNRNVADQCPQDKEKYYPGKCGCGVRDTDEDHNGILDCFELGRPIDGLLPGGSGVTATYYQGSDFLSPLGSRVENGFGTDWTKYPQDGIEKNSAYGYPGMALSPGTSSMRIEGYVLAPTTETYTISYRLGDKSLTKLYVNGLLTTRKAFNSATGEQTWDVSLKKGVKTKLRLDVVSVYGQQDRVLTWRSPSQPEVVIPRSNLFPGDNFAPSVALTGGIKSGAFDTAVLNAGVNDIDGTVVKVEFFEDSTPLSIQTKPPFSLERAKLSRGSHSFRARATDNLGLSSFSNELVVAVVDPSPPQPTPVPTPRVSPTPTPFPTPRMSPTPTSSGPNPVPTATPPMNGVTLKGTLRSLKLNRGVSLKKVRVILVKRVGGTAPYKQVSSTGLATVGKARTFTLRNLQAGGRYFLVVRGASARYSLAGMNGTSISIGQKSEQWFKKYVERIKTS